MAIVTTMILDITSMYMVCYCGGLLYRWQAANDTKDKFTVHCVRCETFQTMERRATLTYALDETRHG